MENKQPSGNRQPAKPLLKRAEKILCTSQTEVSEMSAEELQSLVHQLLVHQLELEIQNEELRQAQMDVGGSRIEREACQLNNELERQIEERTAALQMLYDVAAIANVVESPEEAIQSCLKRVCQYKGWSFGRAYLPTASEPTTLLPAYTWSGDEPIRFERFHELTLGLPPKVREGLPSRVFASGNAECVIDIGQEFSIHRSPLAEHLDIQAAAAFPIVVGEKVVGVLEFFATRVIEPDAHLLEAMANVGTQIGRVVEREKALLELRTREAHYRAVVETAGSVIVELTPDHKIVEWNHEAERIYGWSREDVVGKDFFDVLLPPEHHHSVAENIRKELSGHRTHNFEITVICRAGHLRTISWNSTRLLDSSSRPTGIIAMGRDVTEEKRAERARRETEERFEAFMNNSPAIAWMKDHEGRYVYLSKPYERRIGVRFDKWEGKTDLDLWPVETAEQLRANDLDVLASGNVLDVVEQVPGHDGKMHYWWSFKFPFVAMSGMTYVGGIAVEITERLVVERALRDSEERLELALSASELGMWDTNLVTGEMTVDNRWAEMLGYSLDEIEPHTRSWAMLIHPDDLPRVVRERSRHLEGRTASCIVEHRLRTRSGQWKWIRSRGRVSQRDESGRPLRLTGTHRDITERKTLEREVVETAAEEQRRIGQELHDGIGGELTGIGFTLQALIDDLQSADSTLATTVAKIGDELDRVIEQVRLLSHGLNPVEIDRQGLTCALEKLATRTRQLYGIPCDFHRVGPAEVEDNFVADHLYRIAQEAVANAVKHGDPQQISLTLESDDSALVLQVSDDGTGIKDQDLASEGIGLRNMQYRAGLIGADLQIEPAAQSGTIVRCRFTSERLN